MHQDLLQKKIDAAFKQLPEISQKAISSFDWTRQVIEVGNKHKLHIDQIEDLELETNLLLVGLIMPEEYPKKIKEITGFDDKGVSNLISDMNDMVFMKIRDTMIDMAKDEKPVAENKPAMPPALAEKKPDAVFPNKLSGAFKIPAVKTEYTVPTITSPVTPPVVKSEPIITPVVPPKPPEMPIVSKIEDLQSKIDGMEKTVQVPIKPVSAPQPTVNKVQPTNNPVQQTPPPVATPKVSSSSVIPSKPVPSTTPVSQSYEADPYREKPE